MVTGIHSEIDPRDIRTRVLGAASRLIAAGGVTALTTRGVAAAAGIQAPTLYRLFGDKRGLLNAVADHGQAAFVADKAAMLPDPDPVQNLANAWDNYVAFGLAHPAVFAIMNEVGTAASASPAMVAGLAILRERVERVARAGRLRVSVDRAVALIHAAGVGTVTTLLSLAKEERDPRLSPAMRDGVFASVIADPSSQDDADLVRLAVALRAHLGGADALSPGERLLLSELLDRLAKPVDG